MTRRWTHFAVISLLLGSLAAGGASLANTHVAAHPVAADATATPGFGDTATPIASESPTAATGASASATATFPPPRTPLKNPTPIPSHRNTITLPKPVVVVVGSKTMGTGLGEKAAFQLANSPKNLISFLIAPPAYIPKGFALQLIQVSPAQDQQTPAQVALQYIPKGLKKVPGTYPSLYLYKQLGTNAPLVYPGGKVQTVTVRAGKKGVGVVKGQMVDIKLHNGTETVLISWSTNGVNYQVTSVVSISKLTAKDLLAVAGSFQ